MEVKQTIDDAERGLEVPNWRMRKDPQWWIDYLKELGIEQ
jgi:hypothetical protein